MPWFAIRAVYGHAQEPDGINTYEERLLLFRADGVGEAFALAEDESRRYLEINPGFQRIGDMQQSNCNPIMTKKTAAPANTLRPTAANTCDYRCIVPDQ